MERYICPDCGANMEAFVEDGIIRMFLRLKCPKCSFAMNKSQYDFIRDLGKYGVAKLPPKEKDKGKREMSEAEMIFHAKNGDDVPENAYMPRYAVEKPPIGCAPYYVGISARICELCEAIKRYSTVGGKHDKIRLWAYEILHLNEMDRNLRYEKKRKVWAENDDGKLQEMP